MKPIFRAIIGSGKSGRVYRVQMSDQTIALKYAISEEAQPQLDCEYAIYQIIGPHKSIATFYEEYCESSLYEPKILIDDEDKVIAMDAYPYKLTDFDLDDAMIVHYFKELALALRHMHKKRVAHLDLKLSHLLLNEVYELKVIDFGLSVYQPEGKIKGPKKIGPYTSPEIVASQGKQMIDPFKADIYSLGVCLFKMLYGRFPDPSVPNFGHSDFASAPDCVRALVTNCLSEDAHYGMDIDQICECEYVTQSDLTASQIMMNMTQ